MYLLERYIYAKNDLHNNLFNFIKDNYYLIINEEPDAFVFEKSDGSVDQIAKGYLSDQQQLQIVVRRCAVRSCWIVAA